MVTVTIDGVEKGYEAGTPYEEIAAAYQERYDDTIALVMVDGKITELMKTLTRDCELQFVTLKNSAGHKAYVRTAIMLLIKALYEIMDKAGQEGQRV